MSQCMRENVDAEKRLHFQPRIFRRVAMLLINQPLYKNNGVPATIPTLPVAGTPRDLALGPGPQAARQRARPTAEGRPVGGKGG